MDMRRIAVIWFAVLTIFSADRATAHPLGNFSISHYSAIHIGKDAVELRYIIDMAEIPTFQEIQENRITIDAEDGTLQAYLTRKAEFSAAHYYHNPEFTPEENARTFGKCKTLTDMGTITRWKLR